MSLMSLLAHRTASGQSVRVALIGAGKFGAMFLAQVPTTPGLKVTGVCDLSPERARETCRKVGWSAERIAQTTFSDSPWDLIDAPEVEVVIEATGDPMAGIAHARACFARKRHVVMVNVEADALCGPLLAREAAEAGVVYTLASGDQPALVAELVDWARSCGFEVVAAGKGTKYLRSYHASTPETVWTHYGIDPRRAAEAGMNPRMFNSFLDGTKSAIEMAALANACGLDAPEEGLGFPPCGVDDLPHVLRPVEDGGRLARRGMVEVVSSLERDGRPVHRDLRWGVFVVFAAPSAYAARCFTEYGMVTDSTGRYTAIYRPRHLIGLELNTAVLSAALRRESVGHPASWRADVGAIAKRDLAVGEILDGEGGFRVWGRLMPAKRALAGGVLPIGLANKARLIRPVVAGTPVRWSDVALDETCEAVTARREMESIFQP
ncbi:NAD(P)H-dependent oxidoreductase [Pararhodospirillum oryzae]|uniref:Flagellar protein FlgA n=1 Tax=Pararhodospirillum oryzae TaxID=478448 RepID=A0A512H965_9PROT|nr:Gfo/Idh/MocA family oxidoreductase [Pararhodospirillum oryzae]GEO81984.1 flagellar protein FlgA [Pararhodospirillum oryzae]